jgi:aminomethyltransferase
MAVQSKQVPRAEARVGPADAKAYEVRAGEYVQIEDLQGCQVSDFLAFHRDRPGVGISTTVTRALVDGLFPLPGERIYDREGNRLLELVEGHGRAPRHVRDCLQPRVLRRARLSRPPELQRVRVQSDALAAFGYEPRPFREPINFFYNTKIGPDGRVIEPAVSKAGDYVLMRAERDLVVASSACPDDLGPANGGNPTDIMIRVFPA